jgi:hypothetical protein
MFAIMVCHQTLFSKGVQIRNGKWGVKSITYLLYVDFVRRLVALFDRVLAT